MKRLIELQVTGIKCDMPNCNWRCDAVEFADYPQWLNRPCPRCHGNLLTQRDLDAVKKALRRIAIVNFLFGWLLLFVKDRDAPVRRLPIDMDGRGVFLRSDRS